MSARKTSSRHGTSVGNAELGNAVQLEVEEVSGRASAGGGSVEAVVGTTADGGVAASNGGADLDEGAGGNRRWSTSKRQSAAKSCRLSNGE